MAATVTSIPFAFGPGFLQDHAGHIMADPQVALVELIANAYDAGATEVQITWPSEPGELLQVRDNGCGMTRAEFERRWTTICYNRTREQGPQVEYPPGVRLKPRAAFGQSGKGRHGAFCFADAYTVQTWKDGLLTIAHVEKVDEPAQPFRFTLDESARKAGHGTLIEVAAERRIVALEQIRDFAGSKFLVDPSFSIIINGERLELLKLPEVRTVDLVIEPHGTVQVHHLDGTAIDRTTRLRGITWWVNSRMVGEPSWELLDDEGRVLDGRTAAARRYSFVVEADILKRDVKGDWSGFHAGRRANEVQEAVRRYVVQSLHQLLAVTRKEKKIEALQKNQEAIRDLPPPSQAALGHFVDSVQQQCPTLSPHDLAKTVEVFTKLEKARTGYELLQQLAACSPDDLDKWNALMQQWTASSAEIVLYELGRRLSLIKQLQGLVNAATTDELHELQPLFARGLWMFGPEFEAVDFASNRYMATVIRDHLGGSNETVAHVRADFVALPDRSIGIYAAEGYDPDGGEVLGYRKVLVVELKRGGFKVTRQELRQGEDYATELQKADLVTENTEIIVYVLGASLADDARDERTVGNSIKVKPMRYDTLLQRANSRTFNLQARIEAVRPLVGHDPEVEHVLAQAAQQPELDIQEP